MGWVSGAIDVAAVSKGVYYSHLLSRTMKLCFSGKKAERGGHGLGLKSCSCAGA